MDAIQYSGGRQAQARPSKLSELQPDQPSHVAENSATSNNSRGLPSAGKRRRGGAPIGRIEDWRLCFWERFQGADRRNVLANHEHDPPAPKREGGAGPPIRHEWTRVRKIGLIRLVVKTDLNYKDIAVALRESKFVPDGQNCLKIWKELYGDSAPREARILSKESKDQRQSDLKEALRQYEYFERSLKEVLLSRGPDDNDDINTEHNGTEQHAVPSNIQEPTPPVSPGKPPRFSPDQPESSQKTGKAAKTRADCAKLLDMTLSEFTNLIYPRESATKQFRDSLITILSNRLSFEGQRNSRLDYEPKICRLLRETLSEGRTPQRDIGKELGFEVATLLYEGQDPNAAGPDGMTPLHYATAAGCIPVIWALLCAHANTKAINAEGKSVSAYSRKIVRDAALDPDFPIDRIAHIEVGRELVKYMGDPQKVVQKKRLRTSGVPTKRARSTPSNRTSAIGSSLQVQRHRRDQFILGGAGNSLVLDPQASAASTHAAHRSPGVSHHEKELGTYNGSLETPPLMNGSIDGFRQATFQQQPLASAPNLTRHPLQGGGMPQMQPIHLVQPGTNQATTPHFPSGFQAQYGPDTTPLIPDLHLQSRSVNTLDCMTGHNVTQQRLTHLPTNSFTQQTAHDYSFLGHMNNSGQAYPNFQSANEPTASHSSIFQLPQFDVGDFSHFSGWVGTSEFVQWLDVQTQDSRNSQDYFDASSQGPFNDLSQSATFPGSDFMHNASGGQLNVPTTGLYQSGQTSNPYSFSGPTERPTIQQGEATGSLRMRTTQQFPATTNGSGGSQQYFNSEQTYPSCPYSSFPPRTSSRNL